MGAWPESRGSRVVSFSRLRRAWPGRIGQWGGEGGTVSGGQAPLQPLQLTSQGHLWPISGHSGLEPCQDQDARSAAPGAEISGKPQRWGPAQCSV